MINQGPMIETPASDYFRSTSNKHRAGMIETNLGVAMLRMLGKAIAHHSTNDVYEAMGSVDE